jgi:hypothetical protein
MPNIQYFTPDVSQGISAGQQPAVFALPNSADALLYLVNLGSSAVFFKLGTDNTVTVTPSTGQAIGAGQSLIVGAQGMSYIAICTSGANGAFSTVNMTSGN